MAKGVLAPGAHEGANLVSVLEEERQEVAADETGGARDENFSLGSSLASLDPGGDLVQMGGVRT